MFLNLSNEQENVYDLLDVMEIIGCISFFHSMVIKFLLSLDRWGKTKGIFI